jgi:phosphoribosylformylglycinamidine synthase
MLRVLDSGKVVANVPARSLADQAPAYNRPWSKPSWIDEVQSFDMTKVDEPKDYADTLERLLGTLSIASKQWVYRQYDHMVQINTIALPGSDAAVLRLKGTNKAIALSTDANGRYCHLDPYTGGAIAVAEAARNVACTGATPVAITNCLNFPNPERPEVMWQFRQCIDGMSATCRSLDTPVTGGNVSFYNETAGKAIYPTPVVGMLGIMEDASKMCTTGFKSEGDTIILLGNNKDELGGSEYLKLVTGSVAGKAPELNQAHENALQKACLDMIDRSLLASAHDCAEGGVAVTLAECCFAGEEGARGAEISMSADFRIDSLLFGETQSRIVVSCRPANVPGVLSSASSFGVPVQVIGRVGGDTIKISASDGKKSIAIERSTCSLEKTWREALSWSLS